MTSYFEKGVLARRREERGEGEVVRVTDRVKELRMNFSRDLEAFSQGEVAELQVIRQEAVALVEKVKTALTEKISEWSTKNQVVAKAFPTKEG